MLVVFSFQCSLKVCHKESFENHHVIASFYKEYGTRGTPVECAYDPWDIRAGAVLHVTPVTMDIFHALFWPFFCILIGVTFCVIFCRRCRQEEERLVSVMGTELSKVEEGKDKSDCNATSSKTGLIDSAETPNNSSTDRSWGRFKKHKQPKTPDNKKIKHKGMLKSKAAKKR